MSFDMLVWEGERPDNDADLHNVLDSLSRYREGRVVRNERPDPPSPKIADFVQALLRRWRDCGEEGSPWSCGGTGDADGSSLNIYIRWGREDEVAPFVAGLAKVHGLVCYDQQQGCLRP
ncbi:hypothetical protein ABZ942_36625 [Nocardia sp. NPDC046473]|uniref:hypothetical protein n=1 Tax=Nocardia sp. NPDC046473 TaxID=3155733 RepID=UPI0033E795B4